MNKINKVFADRGDRKLISLYFCAGAPTVSEYFVYFVHDF